MQIESIFLGHVGDSPRMRVLQHFIEGRDFDYTLTDLLAAGVSWGTLHSLIPQLLAVGMIVETRKVGRAILYRINRNHVAVQSLLQLYDRLLLEQLDRVEELAKNKMAIRA